MIYLIHFRPFIDKDINRLQNINEGAYLLMSYHLIAFTDFNPNVDIKNFFGWSMVGVSIINFIYPNLLLVFQGMLPDIKKSFFSKKKKFKVKKLKKSLKKKKKTEI